MSPIPAPSASTVIRKATRLAAWSAALLIGFAPPGPARSDDLVRGEIGCGLICMVFSGPPSDAADPKPAATPVRYPSFEPSEDGYDTPQRSRIRSARRARRPSAAERPAAVRPDAVQPDVARSVASVPASPGPQPTQEDRRKAAMASEEALSVRVGERARRALDSMCTGCLVRRPAGDMPANGRRVEPGAPAEPARRAP